MIKAHTNKYNSYQNIKGVLQKNIEICKSGKILEELVDEYFALMEEIIVTAGKSKKKTNQYTKQKHSLKSEMAQKASALGGAATVYAIDKKDAKLKSALKFSYSAIKYASDFEALNHAGGIESKLRKISEHLGDYMVTIEEIDDLKSTIDEYNKLLQTRGSVKTSSVTAKQDLIQLYKKMDALLEEKLDRMIKLVGRHHPEFAKLYFQARKIYDR